MLGPRTVVEPPADGAPRWALIGSLLLTPDHAPASAPQPRRAVPLHVTENSLGSPASYFLVNTASVNHTPWLLFSTFSSSCQPLLAIVKGPLASGSST